MKTTKNTVLITGGSAGIGLSIAEAFLAADNEVIITGRDAERLAEAKRRLGGRVTTIVSDVSRHSDLQNLAERMRKDFPGLNVLVNNAGTAYVYDPAKGAENAGEEMQTNYLSVIELTEYLLPLLKQQPEAAVVNVTSVLAFTPSLTIPTYSASKAALHSFTQALRLTLRNSTVKVFELMPPLVNTDFSKMIGGDKGIAPGVVADHLLKALENDTYEIHVAGTADVYRLYLSSPENALHAINAARL
ncbi:SDR family oxidoreductase [Dinghuibacter silviterrae]|uniref:Putative oxidoreductase n=1 Tax=Dinghuibacter silviterrae TaxID=1539049 RepID=A0A4R8DFN7_9BACT|nr:SDR family NAD(P)-dependent oxidoreductase [Dinghuibacter silviterrae]TDW96148.1 putative oxidoreductase [Dinghuibacter silviterrae]